MVGLVEHLLDLDELLLVDVQSPGQSPLVEGERPEPPQALQSPDLLGLEHLANPGLVLAIGAGEAATIRTS